MNKRMMNKYSQQAVSRKTQRGFRQQAVNFEGVSARQRRMRLFLVAALMLFGAAEITQRLALLQGTEHARWKTLATQQHSTSVQIAGARGDVFDRDGLPLAVSVEAVAVGAFPKRMRDRNAILHEVSTLLDIPQSTLDARLNGRDTFTWLARALPLETAQVLQPLGNKGISVFQEFKRYYPQGELAGTVLGRVNLDGVGQSGIEGYFQKHLAAENSRVRVERDARGRLVRTRSDLRSPVMDYLDTVQNKPSFSILSSLIRSAHALGDVEFRKQGMPVQLSLSTTYQEILEQEFKHAKELAQAKAVFGVLMDADTGELLAVAQTSSFNPNQKEQVSAEDLRNLVIQDAFEPGSTMKPFISAAALDYGRASPTELLDCENGRYRVGRHTIRDVHPSSVISFADVLIRSSNICMVKLGERLGRENLHRALSDFGFGKASGLELPGEATGILRPANSWRNIDVATASFGQGVAVTALQMVRAYSVFANGGYLVTPTIRKVSEENPAYKERVIEESVAREIANILVGVTEDAHGTAKAARIAGVRVSGKTGTAQKPFVSGRGYDPDRILSSFVGFVDANDIGIDRKFTMLVVVDEPKVKPRWGGVLAAPAFRRSMERVLSHLMTEHEGRASPSTS